MTMVFPMKRRKALRKEGFTLIELLLVIVLIAIIIALVTLSGSSVIQSTSAQTEARRLIRTVQSLRSAWYACYADTQTMLGVKGRGANQTLTGDLTRDLSTYSDRSLAEEISRYGNISVDVTANGNISIGFLGPWSIAGSSAKSTMMSVLNNQINDYGITIGGFSGKAEAVFIRVR